MITIVEQLLHRSDIPELGHVTTMTHWATKERRQAKVIAVKILKQGKELYNPSTGYRQQKIQAEVSYEFL